MSRMWDTPEFWVRTEADEIVRDYPGTGVGQLADQLERSRNSFDGDPVFASKVVGELRRRAAANIRFWPGVSLVAGHAPALASRDGRGTSTAGRVASAGQPR